jgi:hypothetical protein
VVASRQPVSPVNWIDLCPCPRAKAVAGSGGSQVDAVETSQRCLETFAPRAWGRRVGRIGGASFKTGVRTRSPALRCRGLLPSATWSQRSPSAPDGSWPMAAAPRQSPTARRIRLGVQVASRPHWEEELAQGVGVGVVPAPRWSKYPAMEAATARVNVESLASEGCHRCWANRRALPSKDHRGRIWSQ